MDQQALINRLLQELDEGRRRLYDTLTPHEKDFVHTTLADLIRGDQDKLKVLWEVDYVRKPVSIEKFITDPDYFGPLCYPDGEGGTESIYPCWRRELMELYSKENEITEVVVTGCIGSGKTTYALVALAYKLYVLTCLRDPFSYYGLMRGTSSFVFGLFNATRELSSNVHVAKILGAFNSCKYFRWLTQGTTDKLVRETGVLEFPNSIKFAFGSRAMHALGQDIIGGLLDEMNFQTVTDTTNQARDLYRNTKRRIESRFPARPGVGRKSPGLLFLVSSRKSDEDFLDQHIKEHTDQTGTSTRIISFSLWEAKGHIAGMYSGKTFRMLVGDDRHRSRILEDGEPSPDGYRVIDVPVEHRKEFVDDPDGSLMDLAGVSIKGGGRPLIQRDKIYECIDYDKSYYPRSHPFKVPIVTIGVRSDNMIEDDFIPDNIVQCVDPYAKKYVPRINPLAKRFIHLDPATTGDCRFGFCMGHVAGRTKVVRRDKTTLNDYSIVAPIIYIDLVLGIYHPPGDEIDFAKVRSFIFFLRKLGFPISHISADTYQSSDTLQIFKKLDYTTKRVSLDLKPDNYGMFRQAIHEGRLYVYDYSPFIEEAIWLQQDPTDDYRVFCLEKRHKDISDAVAGVVAHIMETQEAEHGVVQPLSAMPAPTKSKNDVLDMEGDWLLDSEPLLKNVTGVR